MAIEEMLSEQKRAKHLIKLFNDSTKELNKIMDGHDKYKTMKQKENKDLTEKLKELEAEANEIRIDLNSIKNKLEISYKYQDELEQRRVKAQQNTSELQKEYHQKISELNKRFKDMKNVLDIFTGNFYDY